jgi:hypothetical protein
VYFLFSANTPAFARQAVTKKIALAAIRLWLSRLGFRKGRFAYKNRATERKEINIELAQ